MSIFSALPGCWSLTVVLCLMEWLFFVHRRAAYVLLNYRNHAIQNPGKWTNILYTSIASFAIGAGFCAVPFKQVSDVSSTISCSVRVYLEYVLILFLSNVSFAGWPALTRLPYQASSISGYWQFHHSSLAGHFCSNRCYHRLFQSKFITSGVKYMVDKLTHKTENNKLGDKFNT